MTVGRSRLLHSVNAGVLPTGIYQSQGSTVANVVVGHVELLESCVLLERFSQLQGRLVTHPSMHQRKVRQRLIVWQGFQQGVDSRVKQSVVTKPGEDIGRHKEMSQTITSSLKQPLADRQCLKIEIYQAAVQKLEGYPPTI